MTSSCARTSGSGVAARHRGMRGIANLLKGQAAGHRSVSGPCRKLAAARRARRIVSRGGSGGGSRERPAEPGSGAGPTKMSVGPVTIDGAPSRPANSPFSPPGERTQTRRNRAHSGRTTGSPRCPRAQPQGCLAGPAQGRHDRLHRAVRLRQVQPGVRHDLRRRAAPVRRVAVGLRQAVPRPDGQARRRLHRRAVPGRLDRPEGRQPQPALDGRHGHRGLRLPAAAVRQDRQAALPGLRPADRQADAAADRGPGAGVRRGHQVPGARAGHPRPQGRVHRAAPRAADQGLLARQGGRRDDQARRRDQRGGQASGAEEVREAHDRGDRRPAVGEGVGAAAADRLGGDGARPVRRRRGARLRRPAGGRPQPGADVLRAPGLPVRRPVVRGA